MKKKCKNHTQTNTHTKTHKKGKVEKSKGGEVKRWELSDLVV